MKPGRISVNLAKLQLPGPHAASGWSREPPLRPHAREQAISTLREVGLTEAQVQALEAAMALEYSARTDTRDLPTTGADRDVIEAAAALAEGLAYVLRYASPHADAEIETALLGVEGGSRRMQQLASQLAEGLRTRLEVMPIQTRQRPRTGIISTLCLIAGDVLPEPNKWPESPFYRAAKAAFALAGLPGASPDRAIDDFVANQSKGR